MYSLFQIKYFNIGFLGLALVLYFLVPSLSMYSFIAILISLHQFFLLFNSIGEIIPVRYLFGAFMCLQFFIGPTFAYNGIDEYQFPPYRMQVSETIYFQYAIPSVLLFILGLHITAGALKGEYVKIEDIKNFIEKNKKLPYVFIVIGLFSSVFSSFVPSEVSFVLLVTGGFKFVGLFMIFLQRGALKIVPTIVVFGFIIVTSLGQAMFHDLLTWLIFAGAVFCIRYKPNVVVKLSLCITFILLSVIIQQLKTGLRQAGTSGVETFADVYYKQQQKNEIFGFSSLAPSNVRINQGFIITHIMKTVPAIVPYANGSELYQILEAAFLPRVIAPNKLQAGDRTIFMKYSGVAVSEGTSMGLSALGDGYINYGIWGGSIFMFFLGLGYSTILNYFYKYSKYFPLLILCTPVIFYFPIRPDSELQTTLGHAVKGTFVMWLIFYYGKKHFYYNNDEENKIIKTHDNNSLLLPAQ